MSETRQKTWRQFIHSGLIACLLPASGCALMWNPSPPTSERQTLRSITRITDDFTDADSARFSGDGDWIVFHAAADENTSAVYLAQLRRDDAGEPRGIRRPIRVTPTGMSGGNGGFSRNGISLFLAGGERSHVSQSRPIQRIFRADGWQGAVAALAPGDGIDLARHPITSGNHYNGQVDASPDGKWLVFTSTRDGDPELYLMPSDGGAARRLTHHEGFDGWGRFSPDGNQLLFQRSINGQLQIMLADWIFDNQGRPCELARLRPLTRDGGDWPCWHPDGRHILYASTVGDGDTELFVMRADGSRRTRLTFTAGPDLLPAVSPDGQWLIWSSGRGDKARSSLQLYLARLILPEGS